MWRAGIHRRLVALVAAYGLALQGLLAAVAVVSPALALDAVVCSAHAPAPDGPADHNSGGNAPSHDPDCALCPLACGSAAVAPPAHAAMLVAVLGPGQAMPAPRPAVPVVRPVVPAGLARAPPA